MSGLLQKGVELTAEEKRALLAELLSQQAQESDVFPLSFAQQRLWFLTQIEPDNPSYNIPQVLKLGGRLDVTALQQTLDFIVDRHESLRTTFKVIAGEPFQVVSPSAKIKISLIDLEDSAPEKREDEARRIITAEGVRPFDLSKDLPLRVTLLRLADRDHFLLLTMHHIVSDGWSMGVFTRELSTVYQIIVDGEQPSLPELPIQYSDFAEWQRDWLQGEVLERQINFWKKSLANAPTLLDLPADHPRPPLQSFSGAHLTFTLPPDLSEKINELSMRSGVTLFMLLLAAFKTLLSRYTGEEDIVVGTPIAGRNQIETEGLIGFFVNTLALRTDLGGNPTFRELLQRVRDVALGAFAHQDLPFEKLVEELNPVRAVSHSPLFQVLFILQNVPREALRLGELSVQRLPAATQTAKFDLTFQVSEGSSGINCWLEYNTDLFERSTIERLRQHLEVLLAGIVANPDCRLSELPLLTTNEVQQLLIDWNQTETKYSSDKLIHELFQEQARETPERVALSFKGKSMTFAELNKRSNQLAHYLRKQGVRPESRVAVCLERSMEMVVAVLAVLKAGGAFVPIDPAYPVERIAFLLEDSQSSTMIVRAAQLSTLPVTSAVPICIDKDWQKIASESSFDPDSLTCSENAAFVIYTSGSTGLPKGVVSLHHAYINRFEWMWKEYPFTTDDVGSQKTTLGFADSIWEIFGALLKGVPLVIIPDEAVKDPHLLIKTLSANKVTRIVLVPSLLQVILEQKQDLASKLPALKYWTCSGERLPLDLARLFAQRLPDAVLINLYGSTEIGADATCFEVKHPTDQGNIPIGRPIANTEAYVLGRYLEPVPVGVHGELYIAGAGVARSYHNQGDLTAERFIPCHFNTPSGKRMFKTGDVVRYRGDGQIEFIGRRDLQVKLRGFRIELGEIEAVLKSHPQVEVAVAMLMKVSAHNEAIVCYVVPSRERSDDASFAAELRQFSKQKLPEYMAPTTFVVLETLPLTPSGKIDRRALPLPDSNRGSANEARLASRDDFELRLVQIWEQLLGVSPVGVKDNFFDLGGHSLLAVRLVAQIEAEFGKRLPLVSLFQDATVEGLANLLRTDVAGLSWPTAVEIQPEGSKPPLFCVSTPNVNALGYRTLSKFLGADQPVYGLQAQYPEDLDGEHSNAAVEELATEYLEAMKAIRPHGPYQMIGMCRGAHIAYEIARRLVADGEKVSLLGILDTWVIENTYNRLLYVGYYYRRAKALVRLNSRQIGSLLKRKLREEKTNDTSSRDVAVRQPRNPMHVYFPGPNFVPKTYNGDVAVFRVRWQPLNRIRDTALGWRRLTTGKVNVFVIPGKHGTVLQKQSIAGLAAALKKCLSTEAALKS
ncbi:MAG TPA: amino acid adenylation domain-containing protein [Pyrinomonadaceae bacterium]|nr:amino acid adenylation domain-containing protein [Pyrinomonadaceae bacterium]